MTIASSIMFAVKLALFKLKTECRHFVHDSAAFRMKIEDCVLALLEAPVPFLPWWVEADGVKGRAVLALLVAPCPFPLLVGQGSWGKSKSCISAAKGSRPFPPLVGQGSRCESKNCPIAAVYKSPSVSKPSSAQY